MHKENVTITRDYEAILMFYGYDLGIDMVSSTVAPTTTTTSTAATTTAEKDTTPNIATTEALMAANDSSTTTVETVTTDMPPSSEAVTTMPTTEESTMTTLPSSTTTVANDSTDTTPEMETTTIASTNGVDDTTTEQLVTDETTTESAAETTTASLVAGETPTNEAAELITSFVAESNAEPLLRIQKARVTRLPSAKLQAPLSAKLPQTNYLPSQRKSKRLTTARSKRHVFGFKDLDSNLFVSLLNSEALLHHLPSSVTAYNAPLNAYVPVSHEFEVETEPNFISTSSAAIKQNYNTDVITHVFYLSSQQIIYTTFKVYNAVLYYKYFEHLRMSVLELELDTPDYNLIILLPDYNTDLVTAAAALRSGPKLRLMRKQLKPKWVQAIIPDFKLHGTMFLTNDLQNVSVK